MPNNDSISQAETLSSILNDIIEINLNTISTVEGIETKLYGLGTPTESNSSGTPQISTFESQLVLLRKLSNKINANVGRLSGNI